MHIGNRMPHYKCENSYIDTWKTDVNKPYPNEEYGGQVKVKVTHSTKYLGKVVRSDGKNTDNISQRKKRGFGTITDIVNILDPSCLTRLWC